MYLYNIKKKRLLEKRERGEGGKMVYGVLHKLRHPRHSAVQSLSALYLALLNTHRQHISRPYIPPLFLPPHWLPSLPPIWAAFYVPSLSLSLFLSPALAFSIFFHMCCACVCICAVTSISLFSFDAFYYSPLIPSIFCSSSSASASPIFYFVLARVAFISTSLAHTGARVLYVEPWKVGSPSLSFPLIYLTGRMYTQSQKAPERKRTSKRSKTDSNAENSNCVDTDIPPPSFFLFSPSLFTLLHTTPNYVCALSVWLFYLSLLWSIELGWSLLHEETNKSYSLSYSIESWSYWTFELNSLSVFSGAPFWLANRFVYCIFQWPKCLTVLEKLRAGAITMNGRDETFTFIDFGINKRRVFSNQ